jgi:hypothetical protein
VVDEVVTVARTFGVGISAVVSASRLIEAADAGEVLFDDSYQAIWKGWIRVGGSGNR